MKTKLKLNNYLEHEEVIYLGIPINSDPDEIDAFISLLNNELIINHKRRELIEVKKR